MPTPADGTRIRTVRPRQDSGGSGVFFAAADRGRQRVFFDLVYDKAQLHDTRFTDFVSELAGKRGEAARFSGTRPDTGASITVKIARDRDVAVRSTGLYTAETILTLEEVT